MPTRFLLRTVSLSMLALVGGCSQEEVMKPIATASYEPPLFADTPFPQENGCWEDNTSVLCPLKITKEGQLLHQGVPASFDNMPAIQTAWDAAGFPILGVAVHPQAELTSVVELLAQIGHAMDGAKLASKPSLQEVSTWEVPKPNYGYALVDLEKRYRDRWLDRNLKTAAEFADHKFLGEVDRNNLPIFVGYSFEFRECVFKIDDIYLSAPELRDFAFNRLDDIVANAAGVGKIMSGELVPVAYVQANRATPWSCVGAAAYQVTQSGWPMINFEVMDVEIQSRSS